MISGSRGLVQRSFSSMADHSIVYRTGGSSSPFGAKRTSLQPKGRVGAVSYSFATQTRHGFSDTIVEVGSWHG